MSLDTSLKEPLGGQPARGSKQISSPWSRGLSITGLRESSYVTVNDPRDLYHDVVVALDRAKDSNNGLPSALASRIDALALRHAVVSSPSILAANGEVGDLACATSSDTHVQSTLTCNR